MSFDLRFPLGLLFSTFGLILTVFGFLSNPDLYKKSLDININLIWGLVLLVFGAAMLTLAWRTKSASKPAAKK